MSTSVTTSYSFAPFTAALDAARSGSSPVICCDVSNFMPWLVELLSGPDKPKGLHALTHSKRVGALEKYKGDVSTACAFSLLDDPNFESQLSIEPGSSVLLSNDHFDHDGLLAITTLLYPDWARERRELLIEAAEAGDFNKLKNRDAARIVWTIDSFTRPSDPSLTPLPKEIFQFDDMNKLFEDLYGEMLPRIKEIVDNVDKFEKYWEKEDKLFDETTASLRLTPAVSKHPDLSFACVHIDPSLSSFSRFAVYSHLAYAGGDDCYLVAIEHLGKWDVNYRYEAYVNYISSPTPPIIAFSELAEHFNQLEADRGNKDAQWTCGDISSADARPHFGNKGKTVLDNVEVEGGIVEYLRNKRGLDGKGGDV